MAESPYSDYLGDGVYVREDGWHVWLVTFDGYRETNKVALDPDVLESFLKYIEKRKKRIEEMMAKAVGEGKD